MADDGKGKNIFRGFSDDDEVIVKDNEGAGVSDVNKDKTPKLKLEKTADEIAAEKQIADKAEADRLEAEKKKAGEKTAEQLEEERLAERAEKYKGKTEEEIAVIEEKENEISLDLKLDDDIDDDKDKDKDLKPLNYLDTAKELELTLEEDEKELTKEAFVERVKEKIESSKEKFNYQHIPEDVLDVVKFFAEDGGTTADLLSDHDVVLAEVYLSMDSESKFLRFQSDKLERNGLDKESAAARAQELWDQKPEKEQAQAIAEIDSQIIAFKNQAIKEVVGKRKEIVQKQKVQAEAKAKAERTRMVDIVKGMTEFMGMQIPKEINDKLVRKIENGDIDKVLNNVAAKARVNAFMIELFGKQINETSKKILSDTSRESYNKGVQKLIEKNHNVKPERREKGQQTEKKDKKFDFSGIDNE
jgi:hypothetical protein